MVRVVAEGAADGVKVVLTRRYLGMLRAGSREPSLRTAHAIASAFAELARRSGEACESADLLAFLAGDQALLRDDDTPVSCRCCSVRVDDC